MSTYISWSSLSLPSPRMRKTSETCMVSAAHPLVTWSSYRLFRFSSCRYVTKGVIIIGQPPLRGDRKYLRAGRSSPRWSFCVQWWDSSVSQHCRSELDTQLLCCWLYKSTHQSSAYILSQLQNNRRDRGLVSFLMTTCRLQFVLACVCANHFTSDCFSNECQNKAGFASTLTLIKGSVSPIPDPATAPEPPISVPAVW